MVERTTEQRQHEIVAANRELGDGVGDGAVVLGRPAGAAALGSLDRDLEVPAGGELVEVVAGDVGMQAELGRRPAAAVTPLPASRSRTKR